MSFPFKGTVTRISNGTAEITAVNQFDLQKMTVGEEITVDAADADKAPAKKSAAKKNGKKK